MNIEGSIADLWVICSNRISLEEGSRENSLLMFQSEKIKTPLRPP